MHVGFLLFSALEWSLGTCLIPVFRSLFITSSFLPFFTLSSVESLITIFGLFVFLPNPLSQLVLTLFLPKVLFEAVSSKMGGHTHGHTYCTGQAETHTLFAHGAACFQRKVVAQWYAELAHINSEPFSGAVLYANSHQVCMSNIVQWWTVIMSEEIPGILSI